MSRCIRFKNRSGEGTPMILAIVLVLLMLFCAVAEYSRVWLIAQGVKEATQQAVLSTVNDNYNDVYHAVREGYAAGWFPDDSGGWEESIDEGDIYAQLAGTLGLNSEGDSYVKYAEDQTEYVLSNLTVVLRNNALASGVSTGYTAVAEIQLEVPIRFLGRILPSAQMTLHVEGKYIPLF